jgi:hypothetical protein
MYAEISQVVCLLHVFRLKLSIYFSSFPYLLHVLPISSSLFNHPKIEAPHFAVSSNFLLLEAQGPLLHFVTCYFIYDRGILTSAPTLKLEDHPLYAPGLRRKGLHLTKSTRLCSSNVLTTYIFLYSPLVSVFCHTASSSCVLHYLRFAFRHK